LWRINHLSGTIHAAAKSAKTRDGPADQQLHSQSAIQGCGGIDSDWIIKSWTG